MTPFIPNTEGVWLDLPAEVYHKAQGVSQSTLKDFDSYATPAHFKASPPKKPTPDMEFGTVCHAAILEPERYGDGQTFHLRPEMYPDSKSGKPKPWHNGAEFCKEWNENHSGLPVMTNDDLGRIGVILASVRNLPEFASAIRSGQREVSYFKRDEHTGLLCKCRPDVIATAEGGETWIFDLKKVQSGGGGLREFQKSVFDYGYHIQAASYLQITGASHFVFVCFDDDEPFGAIQWEADEDTLAKGERDYRRILNRYAECVKEDRWPGYASGICKLEAPRWVKRELEAL